MSEHQKKAVELPQGVEEREVDGEKVFVEVATGETVSKSEVKKRVKAEQVAAKKAAKKAEKAAKVRARSSGRCNFGCRCAGSRRRREA